MSNDIENMSVTRMGKSIESVKTTSPPAHRARSRALADNIKVLIRADMPRKPSRGVGVVAETPVPSRRRGEDHGVPIEEGADGLRPGRHPTTAGQVTCLNRRPHEERRKEIGEAANRRRRREAPKTAT